MNKFADFTNSMNKLESEAWDWIIRLDAEEPLSEREKSIFSEWLSRSPAHIEQIRKLNEFWDNPVLLELLEPQPQQVSAKSQRSRPMMRPVYAFSLVFMLCAVGVLMYWNSRLNPTSELVSTRVSNQTYSTAVGEQTRFLLQDGSQVLLNGDSQIKVAYTEGARDIWLTKGAGHFDVAKDKSRPFNVYAANGRVQAVGTAFSVDLIHSAVEVLVTEGRIALAVAEQKIARTGLGEYFSNNDIADKSYSSVLQNVAMMGAGEFVSFEETLDPTLAEQTIGQRIVTLSDQEIEAKQAWTQGEILLNGESLQEVVEQLRRYSSAQIEIADPALAELQIGGRFKIDQLDALLESLELNFDLDVERTATGKIIISQKPAN